MTTPFSLFGTDLFGDPIKPPASGPLAERFGVPPFTLLNANLGDWQDRKRAWLALGIQSEVGRSMHRDGFDEEAITDEVRNARWGETKGKLLTQLASLKSGSSIFDPVLAELACRWFSRDGAKVLDPFAGGSVRGVIAALVGRQYTGIELRPEQVAANRAQAEAIVRPTLRGGDDATMPRWVEGDSTHAQALVGAEGPYDMLLSCPPYGDLEVYSDLPTDLSTMDWPQFLEAYRRIIKASVDLLRPNRFAVWVVGDFRDKRGFYRGFPWATVQAFADAGAGLYNDAILCTPPGTLPIRTQRTFDASRKMGKHHQNVLVFCKGDPVAAARWARGD